MSENSVGVIASESNKTLHPHLATNELNHDSPSYSYWANSQQDSGTDSGDDSDGEVPLPRAKNRVRRFSDSDSDSRKENLLNHNENKEADSELQTVQTDSDGSGTFKSRPQKSKLKNVPREKLTSKANETGRDSDSINLKIKKPKQRIRNVSKSTDSDSSEAELRKALKNNEEHSRIKNKRKKMQDKFKSLLSSRKKENNKKTEIKSDVELSDKLQCVQTDSDGSGTSKSQHQKSKLKNGSSEKQSSKAMETSSDSDSIDLKSKKPKQRIRNVSKSTDSDSSDAELRKTLKNEEQRRIQNKRENMQDKFKSLLSSRNKENNDETELKSDVELSDKSSDSDAQTSVEKLKQKIKQRSKSLKMSICDPDTSDEESELSVKIKSKPKKQKNVGKSTILTSPKPMRMTAKEAMENMQKIKSESNRMLREKEVSLPYHRAKAVSLKDIMSRRRPAVSADGKALPIKMNEEQLRQYALALEERQKEMIELCKSESEDDENSESENNTNEAKDLNADAVKSAQDCEETPVNNDISTQNEEETAQLNDTLYDDLLKADKEDQENDEPMDMDLDNYELIVEKVPKIPNEAEIASNADQTEEENSIPVEKVLNIENLNDETKKDVDVSFEGNSSADMSLVYNDSVEEPHSENNKTTEITADAVSEQNENETDTEVCVNSESKTTIHDTEDSQQITLQYENTEKPDLLVEDSEKPSTSGGGQDLQTIGVVDGFSDDDMNMEDIDKLIEDAEIIQSQNNYADSPMLIKEPDLKKKPKLTGHPGMVIDLDGADPCGPKKLTGIELLKERFTYFSKLKTPEELERMREKRLKPGTQHIKLKQELEDKIAEQRSLEWAKRLEEEKQQQIEMNTLIGDDEEVDDIDKIEAKLEQEEKKDFEEAVEESSEEEEEEEMEKVIQEKPRKRNPLVADEAEESDCEEYDDPAHSNDEDEVKNDPGDADDSDKGAEADSENDSSDSSDEESESEEEQSKPKKGRILKAFEDSDEENEVDNAEKSKDSENIITAEAGKEKSENNEGSAIKETQDEELQLAQVPKSHSEDLFASQESEREASLSCNKTSPSLASANEKVNDETDLGTQSFSIMNTVNPATDLSIPAPEKLNLSETQTYVEGDLDAVVGMCSGSFSQNLVTPQYDTEAPSQIGEDVLALCTGQFYDNQFVSQLDVPSQGKLPNSEDDKIENTINDVANESNVSEMDVSQDKFNSSKNEDVVDAATNKSNASLNEDWVHLHTDSEKTKDLHKIILDETPNESEKITQSDTKVQSKTEDKLLNSLIDELNDPEFDTPKPSKYFGGNGNAQDVAYDQSKKKFIIDSDDEGKEDGVEKKKKRKKKKLEQRALQISDDEDEEVEEEEVEDEEEYMSAVEEDPDRIVEYDSEENEVEVAVAPQLPLKKKRKATEFFEQEAELTSEDEWAGSGDEDERGLDRMEREEGDDETFNQSRLQRELGQIHMRDVLDQDKREVRLIQELLFEDGDLGGGGRQRKFRWRNADGEEELGTMADALADTQEEEFESEEQWRKQRHEREMFLRQMQETDEEKLNVSLNRTTIIKANLSSKTMSSLLLEVNSSKEEIIESPIPEKKTGKDVPSPKKHFAIFQQSYHGSLLQRGRGALARLAAIASPLAGDDQAPKGSLAPTSNRNFVFAAVTPEEPKVTKRKAETKPETPRLVKKMRTEDKQNRPRNSLLDHI